MRILFHYTHKQTLGHTTRSISFVNALREKDADVLLLQGGLPQPFVSLPPGCKTKDIPFPFDTRASFQAHAKPVSAAQRAKFILKTATEFNPDIFITEFFPFGRHNYMPELLPTLRYFRKKRLRVMASIGYPLLVDLDRFEDKRFSELMRALFAFFDTFLIHTPPELETRYFKKLIKPAALAQTYSDILNSLEKKIVYTGYIFPDKFITGGTQIPVMENSDFVLVSRGGGSVCPRIITRTIEAQRYLDDNIRTVVACGPATSSKEMALFQSLLKPQDKDRVYLAAHLNNLHDYLRCCRVSVSLSGYNTSVQLMRYGTPSVIMPYTSAFATMPVNDQIVRAGLLQEKFSSIVLDPRNTTAKDLAKAINEQMRQPRPAPAPEHWFNGAVNAAEIVFQDKAD